MSVTFDSLIASQDFYSILWKPAADIKGGSTQNSSPDYFIDLNLNQVVNSLADGREEYNLKPFFYTPLYSEDAILYRQEIMKDLEKSSLFKHIKSFSKSMHEMRTALSSALKSRYKYQKERLFLGSVQSYLEAVRSLSDDLMDDDIESSGMLAFRKYLSRYLNGGIFLSLSEETEQLNKELSSVRYCIQIHDLLVRVLPCDVESSYSVEIEALFRKFRRNTVKDYRKEFPASLELDHVEAAILDGVARLYPSLFSRLDGFYEGNGNYQDNTIVVFDREIQFYVAYLEYIDTIRRQGLSFCYPHISASSKHLFNKGGFDLALAHKLSGESRKVVSNDFYLGGKERIIIVTGPNQGGKTTFARTFGQLHYLACLGCPVPGEKSQLFLFDQLLTHFEKEEDITDHHSKFEEDLYRIHDILVRATPDSIIIMNEILSSTTLQDSVLLSKKIMEKIVKLDALCVWVTFIDELIALSETTVSMTSTVEKSNPAVKTFKVERRAADGLAYALSIAEKYAVTYRDLIKRLKS
jgi:hypothetical protein